MKIISAFSRRARNWPLTLPGYQTAATALLSSVRQRTWGGAAVGPILRPARAALTCGDEPDHAVCRVEPGWWCLHARHNWTEWIEDGKSSKRASTRARPLHDGTVVNLGDRKHHRIRAISPAGQVTTIAGDGTEGYQDGQGTAAKFNRPIDIMEAGRMARPWLAKRRTPASKAVLRMRR